MKIAIRFWDNDFYKTFHNVLEVLLSAYKYTGGLPKNKNDLCFIINSLSPIICITHQSHYDYNTSESMMLTENNPEFIQIKQYLQKLTPDRILIDEEVDEYLKDNPRDNNQTFVLDTDLNDDNIWNV